MNVRILISYPSDQETSAETLRILIRESNDYFLDSEVSISAVDWKQNIVTGKSDRAQSVINDQISNLDAIIVIVGHRIGSPTGLFDSGIEEEINVFLRTHGLSNKRIHILFNETSKKISEIEPEELAARRAFRNRIAGEGYLYADFDSEIQLASRGRQAIGRVVEDVREKNKKLAGKPRNRKERRAAKKDSSLFDEVTEAVEEIGEGMTELEPLLDKRKIEKAQQLSSDDDTIQSIVEFLTDVDSVMSKLAIRLKRNLRTIQGAAIKGVAKGLESEKFEDEWLRNFAILGVAQLGVSIAPTISRHYRERAATIQKIPLLTNELEFAVTRSAQSLNSIADTIDSVADSLQVTLQEIGWSVQVPTRLRPQSSQ